MFTSLFILFISFALITELYLSNRQISSVRRHRHQVPIDFSDQLELTAHQKAADYTVAKQRVGQLELVLATVILIGWTLGGGIAWVDKFCSTLFDSTLTLGIAVVMMVMLVSSLIDLPVGLWKTFSLEEKFGFNRTNLKDYFLDLIKGTLLSLVLITPLLAAFFWLMDQAGQLWWLYGWLLWLSFSLLLTWAYPVFIAPLFNKFKQLDDGPLRERIRALLARTDFAGDDIRIMDGSRRSAHSNAYFTGFGRNKRIVFYDTLMEILTEQELEAVLAHELGHFSLHHVRKRLITGSLMTLAGLALLGWLMTQAWFYQSLGVSEPSLHTALLLFMMAVPVFTFPLKPLLSLSSRKHEFEADAFAQAHTGGEPLISALIKLSESNASTVTPDSLHSSFYDSHPPVAMRIAKLATNPGETAS
ncbi:MAG: M48 family metallopeptidase [Immundisolibacteraceae bacterium]|nr:M48 family metallopeptidase [Immundisolibacteraceae bacterium]